MTAHVSGLEERAYLEHVLRSMANAVNGKQPLHGEELRTYVEQLLPWKEEIQERFLAVGPFECKPYTTDVKAVW